MSLKIYLDWEDLMDWLATIFAPMLDPSYFATHRNWSEALAGRANPESVISRLTVSIAWFCFAQNAFASS